MQISIPPEEAAQFAQQIKTDWYRGRERDYEVAVHLVISALLSPRNMRREDFPDLILNVFKESMPDLDALGISAPRQQAVRDGAETTVGGFKGALANLAGGRWGLAQFMWIPRAFDHGLGGAIADAFRLLIVESTPLPDRVEAFRDQLYLACQELENKGGFLPNWRLFRVSLSFVAMILAAHDPSKYTFYSYAALRHGYTRYNPGAAWPKGTLGQRYSEMCAFVQAVARELRAHGVPVEDLIDAQSFIWLSFGATDKKDDGPEKGPGTDRPRQASSSPGRAHAAPDHEAVARDLADATFWPLDRARHLVSLVQRSHQILFQGPPGTGKTFVAEALARLLAGDVDNRVELVQFHPSYAYEDFVEGIRPVVTRDHALAYEVRKGVFLKLADLAREYPEDAFFLVIDELNRANLPRVFGELLYAFEYRGPEHTFRLPYSGDEAYLPANITVIATMNSADRSIALVDAAIRRRFRHVEFAPDLAVLRNWLRANDLDAFADEAVSRLGALNTYLQELLGPDRLIGHTYLMRDDLARVGLHAVWEEDIEPVLTEHLFSRPEEVTKLRALFVAS